MLIPTVRANPWTRFVTLHRRPLNRRYIVVEGIYANTGLLAPLDKMIPLKHKCVMQSAVQPSFTSS